LIESVAVIHADQGDEPDILSDDEEQVNLHRFGTVPYMIFRFQDEMGIIDGRGVVPDVGFRFTDAVELEGGELDGRDGDPFIRRRNSKSLSTYLYSEAKPSSKPARTCKCLVVQDIYQWRQQKLLFTPYFWMLPHQGTVLLA
jgi:E3 ubiquitin-protein ligase HUWE1